MQITEQYLTSHINSLSLGNIVELPYNRQFLEMLHIHLSSHYLLAKVEVRILEGIMRIIPKSRFFNVELLKK